MQKILKNSYIKNKREIRCINHNRRLFLRNRKEKLLHYIKLNINIVQLEMIIVLVRIKLYEDLALAVLRLNYLQRIIEINKMKIFRKILYFKNIIYYIS